ncbi:MAG: HD domain-containing protein [Planctomycetes bacterium]|nr:HD domain-containing protein [Planctomycetota bacterium]
MNPSLPQFQNQQIMPIVLRIALAVRQGGGRAFLVGGAVRDGLLGVVAKDADLEVYGIAPKQLEQLAAEFGAVHLVGKQFAILHLATDAGPIELSLPRTESKTGPGHKGFEVLADPNLPFADASRRRDFTVNAMLQDPLNGEIIDPWNGRADLKRGLLRHVSAAFAEDPLRALRAARFVARFNWSIHPATSTLCRELDLSELPLERLEQEWRGLLLHSQWPGRGLLAMEEVGALRLFPELRQMRGVPQDPIWHPEGDVMIHTALCLDAAVALREQMQDPWVEMLAVLCHDIGKAFTTVFERGRWRSPAHDVLAADDVESFVARITKQQGIGTQVAALVREHLRPSQLYFARDNVSASAIRRLSTRVNIPALVRVAWADAAGRTERNPEPWPPGAWLLEQAEKLGVEKAAPKPLLQGRHLIELGLKPDKSFGPMLKAAFDAQLEDQFADLEQALRWLQNHYDLSS